MERHRPGGIGRVPRRHARRYGALIAAAVLVFLVVRLTLDARTNRQIGEEIKLRETEARELESRNEELRAFARRYADESYAEEEARTRLGYREPGEHVVILNRGAAVTGTERAVSDRQNIPNPERWLNYFFHQKEK